MDSLKIVRIIRRLKTETAAMVVLEHEFKKSLKADKEPVAASPLQRGVIFFRCLISHDWLYCSEKPRQGFWNRECRRCGKRTHSVNAGLRWKKGWYWDALRKR